MKVHKLIRTKETMLENIQLAADMKHNQSKKIIDSHITRDSEKERNGMHDIRQLVLWSFCYVIHVIGLYRHRSARIGNIRQVSYGDSGNGQNDNKDVCQSHKTICERDDYTRDFRISHHRVSLFRTLKS